MRVKYIGHSCFLIEAADGTRVITDPYEPGCYDGALKYRPVSEEADIVLISHDHADHNWSSGVGGDPVIISDGSPRTVKGIEIIGVATFHDTSQGSERGGNVIFRLVVDKLAICHLGDLGHTLDDNEASRLKPVDILLLPVGGFFAIGAEESDDIIGALSPRLVIPMHFKTDGVDFPIAPVDNFLADRKGVTRVGGPEVILLAEDLPAGTLVLDPAALP